MLAREPSYRPAMCAALAALVVLSLSHCSWQESREMAQRARTLSQHRLGLPTPVQSPVQDCDHEFGCMCRGATLVQAIAVSDWQPVAADLLPADFCALPARLVAIDLLGDWADDGIKPPPISGRQLRALYGSLVI